MRINTIVNNDEVVIDGRMFLSIDRVLSASKSEKKLIMELRDQIEKLEKEKSNKERLLYDCNEHMFERDIPFDKIEKALGFRLFAWQKLYILTGQWRRFGQTTGNILRDLLSDNPEPINYSKPCCSRSEKFYRDEMRDIQEKLQAAGVKTRPVLWPGAKNPKNEDVGSWKYGMFKIPGYWSTCFHYQAIVYDSDSSEFGIDGGRIVILTIQEIPYPLDNLEEIKTVVRYSSGWDIKPSNDLYKAALEYVLNLYK